MDTAQYFNQILSQNKKRMNSVRRILKQCPEGKLYEEKKDEKMYFVQTYTKNGERIRRGVTSSDEIVKGLIRREIFSKELDALESMEAAIKKCQAKIVEFDSSECVKAIRKRCPDVSLEMIEEALKGDQFDDWANAEYEQSNYLSDQKTQITSFGIRVRSKSELLIAEKLHEYGIPFRYEQVIHVADTTLIPDFSIIRGDGKKFVWEHEGRTHDARYLEKQLNKEKLYATIGITRWDNFIVTYDDENGNIDLRVVEAEIRNKLMV